MQFLHLLGQASASKSASKPIPARLSLTQTTASDREARAARRTLEDASSPVVSLERKKKRKKRTREDALVRKAGEYLINLLGEREIMVIAQSKGIATDHPVEYLARKLATTVFIGKAMWEFIGKAI